MGPSSITPRVQHGCSEKRHRGEQHRTPRIEPAIRGTPRQHDRRAREPRRHRADRHQRRIRRAQRRRVQKRAHSRHRAAPCQHPAPARDRPCDDALEAHRAHGEHDHGAGRRRHMHKRQNPPAAAHDVKGVERQEHPGPVEAEPCVAQCELAAHGREPRPHQPSLCDRRLHSQRIHCNRLRRAPPAQRVKRRPPPHPNSHTAPPPPRFPAGRLRSSRINPNG